MNALLGAIRAAPAGARGLLTPSDLAPLGASCARLKPYEGVPILQDLADNLNLLGGQLSALTAGPGANGRLSGRYSLDIDAWMAGIRSGAVSCGHAAQALRRLAGPAGAVLLAQARWGEQQRPPRDGAVLPAVQLRRSSLAQGDPWRGLPGCVWLSASADAALYLAPQGRANWFKSLCERPGMSPELSARLLAARPPEPGSLPAADAAGWSVPPDLDRLIAALGDLRVPEGLLYEHYVAGLAAGSNRLQIGRNEVDVGFNIQLTLDARSQRIAQQVAACYTGMTAACSALGIDPQRIAAGAEPGARAMWEGAGARMIGIAIVDVASGRIEALASAHTPCYAQEHDGPGRGADCAPLWTRPANRPEALLNHAVFTDYLPGSTVKPVVASVLFEDAGPRNSDLSRWLATSNSNAFNDELFCVDRRAGGGATGCDRPRRVQRAALALGWNADCTAQPGPWCGQGDLLFGRELSARETLAEGMLGNAGASPLQHRAMAGRIFVAPPPGAQQQAVFQLMELPLIEPAMTRGCRSAGGKWQVAECNSGAIKPLVNEALGQGNARATPLGVATMLARLTAAANGIERVRRPHLVSRITDATGKPVDTLATRIGPNRPEPMATDVPVSVSPDAARRVLDALSKATQSFGRSAGTGHNVCRHVFGPRCPEASRWFAGKTGTPSFSFDEMTYARADGYCKSQPRDEKCLQRPMKWYVAAYKTGKGADARYEKVLAVLSERNFYVDDGRAQALKMRVQDAGDAYNISTEVGMRVIDALIIQGRS